MTKNIMLIGLLLVSVFIIGSTSDLFSLFSDDIFIKPDYGRLECTPLSHVTTHTTDDFGSVDFRGTNYDIMCGDNENSPKCDSLTVQCGGNSDSFAFQSDSVSTCKIESDEWCSKPVTPDTSYVIGTNIIDGEKLRIGGCLDDKDYLFDREYFYPGEVKTYYLPYGLIAYDSGRKQTYQVNSCEISKLDSITKSNIIKTCQTADCNKELMDSTRLEFDDTVNWLSGYTLALETGSINTYNGEEVYCEVNRIYDISTFETTSGKSYKYPNTYKTSVTCCPGMQTANAICNNNFEWEPIVVDECNFLKPCDTGYTCQENKCVTKTVTEKECFSDVQCPGQGQFITDYSSAYTTSRYGCVDNQCKLLETKQVSCTPPSTGCPSGSFCNPNKGYICESQDKAINCGDNVCSVPYEDAGNCPSDCSSSTDWVKYATVSIVFIILGILVFMGARKLIE